MNKFRFLLLLFCLLTSLPFSYTQIHIDQEDDIGIGTENTLDSKVNVNNTTNKSGLTIFNDWDSNELAFGLRNDMAATGSGQKYGFYNTVSQANNANSNLRGIYNGVASSGSGWSYGIDNILLSGTGRKYGLYNRVYQTQASAEGAYSQYNFMRNYGTGDSYGLYSYIHSEGNNKKTGIAQYVYQNIGSSKLTQGIYSLVDNKGSGSSYGLDVHVTDVGTGTKQGMRLRTYENQLSLASTFGMRNQTYLHGQKTGFGIHNVVYTNANSSATKYGIYNFLENEGLGARYALYSGVEGEQDFAGYFSGNVYVSGSVTEMSDVRVKDNIQELTGALAMITKLAPKTYNFKEEYALNLPSGKQYGLIAQDLEKVLPTLVRDVEHPGKPIVQVKKTILEQPTSSASPKLQKRTDDLTDASLLLLEESTEPGSIIEIEEKEIVGYEEDQTLKSVNYKALIPILVGAIKEQNEIVEQQQSQIAALQQDLNQLKKRLAKPSVKK